MPSAKIIMKNLYALSIAEILANVLSFFLVVLIARRLGDTGLGIYSFAFAFAGIFSLFSGLGLPSLMVRDISRDKSLTKKYFQNILAIRMILGVITLILPIVFIFSFEKDIFVIKNVVLASVSTFFVLFSYPFQSLLRAYERMSIESLSRVIERIVALSIGIFVLLKGYDLLALMYVLVLSNFIGFVIYAFPVSKLVKIKFDFDFRFWLQLIKNGFPFFLTAFFLTLYFRIDIIMLSLMKNYAVTGIYSAAYKVIDVASKIPFIVTVALFPAMSQLHRLSKDLLKKLYSKSFYYMCAIALPMAIGTTLLSDRIILFAYKSSFIQSSIALKILIWAEFFLFLNFLMGFLLNSIDKQKIFTLGILIGAISNIALNFILINYYSYIGAGIATLITEIINFCVFAYFTFSYGFRLDFWNIMPKPLAASAVMGLSIWYLSFLHILLLVPIAMAIYFFALFIIKGFGKEEFSLIQRTF